MFNKLLPNLHKLSGKAWRHLNIKQFFTKASVSHILEACCCDDFITEEYPRLTRVLGVSGGWEFFQSFTMLEFLRRPLTQWLSGLRSSAQITCFKPSPMGCSLGSGNCNTAYRSIK